MSRKKFINYRRLESDEGMGIYENPRNPTETIHDRQRHARDIRKIKEELRKKRFARERSGLNNG